MAPIWGRVVAVLAPAALAYPSFRYKLPNGDRVPCPEDAEGCHWQEDDIFGLRGFWACNGLGHTSCQGGGAFNAFGVDFLSNDYEWAAICALDSDGDGDTNGEELGDPCCLLETGVGGDSNRLALDASYRSLMDRWNSSHPGFASSSSAGNEAVACGDYAAAPGEVRRDVFADAELGSNYSYELFIDGYTLSGAQTEYIEFHWNVPDEDAARCEENDCYLVALEAIIDKSAKIEALAAAD